MTRKINKLFFASFALLCFLFISCKEEQDLFKGSAYLYTQVDSSFFADTFSHKMTLLPIHNIRIPQFGFYCSLQQSREDTTVNCKAHKFATVPGEDPFFDQGGDYIMRVVVFGQAHLVHFTYKGESYLPVIHGPGWKVSIGRKTGEQQ